MALLLRCSVAFFFFGGTSVLYGRVYIFCIFGMVSVNMPTKKTFLWHRPSPKLCVTEFSRVVPAADASLLASLLTIREGPNETERLGRKINLFTLGLKCTASGHVAAAGPPSVGEVLVFVDSNPTAGAATPLQLLAAYDPSAEALLLSALTGDTTRAARPVRPRFRVLYRCPVVLRAATAKPKLFAADLAVKIACHLPVEFDSNVVLYHNIIVMFVAETVSLEFTGSVTVSFLDQ